MLGKMKLVFGALIVILSLCSKIESYRILGVFPFEGRSHYILGNALMKGLAEAGHDITMISPYVEKNPPKDGTYRDITLTGLLEEQEQSMKDQDMNIFDLVNMNNYIMQFFMAKMMPATAEKALNHPNVKKLLGSDESFDVVIVEDFWLDGLFAFASHYKAPLVIFSSTGANYWVNPKVGNPTPLAYIPNLFTDYPPEMSFFERVNNVVLTLFSQAMHRLYVGRGQRQLVEKYFPNSPDFDKILYNVSLVLLNSHPSILQAVPLVPNMIPIGGYHVQPPKKLPKDLQEFLDHAKDGVIYFSMGSNLKSKDMHPDKKDAINKAFSKLKQKVLWKLEDENLPGKPANVRLGKWLPQQEILAHPNVKLFITHGGLLSTTEATYNGVPLLAIPIFGDQKMNAKRAVHRGIGLELPFNEVSEETLSERIQELLTNPKYTIAAKTRSALFKDRLVKPMDEAVYWVEYVTRHRGAPHLRVAGVDLPWYKYHLLDVIGFLLLFSLVSSIVSYLVLRKVLRKICSKKASNIKEKRS